MAVRRVSAISATFLTTHEAGRHRLAMTAATTTKFPMFFADHMQEVFCGQPDSITALLGIEDWSVRVMSSRSCHECMQRWSRWTRLYRNSSAHNIYTTHAMNRPPIHSHAHQILHRHFTMDPAQSLTSTAHVESKEPPPNPTYRLACNQKTPGISSMTKVTSRTDFDSVSPLGPWALDAPI